MADVSSTIGHLEAARQVVLTDPTHYGAVVPSILPIIGPEAPLEVRRWGADFIAEAFSSRVLPDHLRETLGVKVLHLLSSLLETPTQDEGVVKSVVQTAACIYGPVFRYMYVHLGIRVVHLPSWYLRGVERCGDSRDSCLIASPARTTQKIPKPR